jgi:hypothetical protein
VRFTEKGLKALHQGVSVLRGIEAELEKRLGTARMRALHAALLDVVDELSRPGP